MNKVGLMIAALIISGCTVKPEVTYKKNRFIKSSY